MKSDIVRTVNLSKRFGKTNALSDLSVSVKENSITGLIGRNGSGKTTLLKIIAGLLNKTDGEVQVFGQQPMDNLSVLSRLVYTYHNVQYESAMRLGAIVYAYKEMFPSFDSEFAEKLMSYFELSRKAKYKSLSQGMCSIFNFLCALSCRAPLTMLDEPVLGMDVTVRKAAYEILLRDFTEYPRTFIISSHLLSELESTLSDILLVEQGQLVLNSPIDDVRQSAYRIDGTPSAIEQHISGKNVIANKSTELSSFAVVYEQPTDETVKSAKRHGLAVSPVRAEDLCVYLTRQNKEEELECLW